MDALKRRAQSVLNDKSIDARSRAIIRYALEVNDPWLAKLVRQADAGESIVDDFSQTPDADEDDSSEKIDALAEMICRASNEAAGALFVLMATLENSTHPKALANAVKHLAFTRCSTVNLCGIVDAQVATVESELFASTV